MRFCLLDRINSFEPGVQLSAEKSVTLSEEYLADHFPEFPVLPGVFMLEAATQAGAWLVRLSDDFAHSIVTLSEARAIKFADFVTPGNKLQIRVEQTKQDDRYTSLRFEGQVGGSVSVSGRLVLEKYNLADQDPEQAKLDAWMIDNQRKQHQLLISPAAAASA
ncbi:MAG: 3-hydroxyacyl-ACP dehydratase FabZ family protein [Planctomycetota bacterium]